MQTAEIIAEMPSTTNRVKDNANAIKWEIRENIGSQSITPDKDTQDNKDTTQAETINTPKQTNLLKQFQDKIISQRPNNY